MPLRRLLSMPRSVLATLPTPLERGPRLTDGPRLWMKRDDLTGLGGGGNKARKLELICAAAQTAGADSLVTVGAAQSNHCRMTAAAGARLGLETHLVLSGDGSRGGGNQALAKLFGAHLHHTGEPDSHWGSLEVAREALTDELAATGLRPYSIPMGGSTALGALGYATAFVEIMRQCESNDIVPAAIVCTSSSGGTHAGLIAGKALWRSLGNPVPDVIGVGVAQGVLRGSPDAGALAREALALLAAAGHGPGRADDRGDAPAVVAADVELDRRWMGRDYAVPTPEGDHAIAWAARRGGWVLDRTYTGKGFAGLLGMAAEGRWGPRDHVVFVHTGGIPSVFAEAGLPG
jgi:1-aminocyclopropane-1-carboxylate deaminase/D-cysteine desulfhydrase-like pyridoxal-dependent ACC family enzyme